jgi:hypothetical protein
MAQHDYVIDNATAAAVRTDLNNALKAIRTSNSGATEPSTTFQNQWWFDTTTNNLKFRNDANSAWVTIGKVDQSDSEWKPHIGGTRVTDFLDENDMGSDSDSAVESQQSIKAYVDNLITKTGTAPVFGVRAFCVWDGTGSTGATTPQASGNIGTLTKDASGQWTVTFTTALPDVNYAVTYTGGGTSASASAQPTANVYSKSAGGFSFAISDASGNTYSNMDNNSFTVVR